MTATKAELMEAAACVVVLTAHETSIGTICIKQASGEDYQFMRKSLEGPVVEHQLVERMIVACLCDDAGKNIFARTEVNAVAKCWSVKAIEEVSGLVRKHCGAWADESSAEGNSETTTKSGSGSD